MLIRRGLQPWLDTALSRGKSILLLGPRQTGKTTLLRNLRADLSLSFLLPKTRQKYEADPSALAAEVETLAGHGESPLVILDEVQKVPEIMDVVQLLTDQKKARFALTGSSARKLRRGPALLQFSITRRSHGSKWGRRYHRPPSQASLPQGDPCHNGA